jgi:hypothetical protein
LLELPTSYLIVWLKGKSKSLLYISFNAIPRVVVASIFIMEILFYSQLLYFYKAIFLLSLPLFFKGYLYCIDQLADKNNKFFLAHLMITPLKDTAFSDVRFKEKNPPFEGAFDIEKEQKNYQLLNWF